MFCKWLDRNNDFPKAVRGRNTSFLWLIPASLKRNSWKIWRRDSGRLWTGSGGQKMSVENGHRCLPPLNDQMTAKSKKFLRFRLGLQTPDRSTDSNLRLIEKCHLSVAWNVNSWSNRKHYEANCKLFKILQQSALPIQASVLFNKFFTS